ncbi:MAG: hypothetical protein BGO51_22400 [Rhodospirillales bacterium 69-11]|nr:MAG: hypothetical protein BGO51_22400 [Rhodospirillales bacterium 69-11]
MSPPPPPDRPTHAATRFWPLWCGAILIPVMLLALSGFVSWTATKDMERARIVQTVQMLRENAARTFATQQAVLTAVQQRIAGMDWPDIARSRAVAAFLHGMADGISTQAVGIVGPDGIPLYDTQHAVPPVAGAPGATEEPGVPATGPTAAIQRIGAATDAAAAVRLSLPRLAAGQPDGGVLWATLTAASFETFYRDVVENPDDEITLTRTDGRAVAAYPRGSAGQVVPRNAADARHDAGGEASASVRLWSDPRFLHGAARVEGLPLSIGYAVRWDNVRSEWREGFEMMVLITVAAMALLLLLTWRVSTHARREEMALLQAAEQADRRAEMAAAFRRGQRLETLGRVVAGVAHDFRNAVQAQIGGAELAQQAIDRGELSRARVVLKMIAESAQRAERLTQRMLRMAQDAPPPAGETPTLALRPAMEAATDLMRRTLGSAHAVRLEMAPTGLPALVQGDDAEFQATLLNLGLNATQAMPEGGTVTITVAPDQVQAADTGSDGLQPGRYVRIAVTDTGIGMDRATLARVGEAFFTTRAGTGGTGLGLAMARAFAEDSGGTLQIWSDGPGRGCTVTLWLAAART